MNQQNQNQPNKNTDEKIKKMQMGIMDEQKCKEFAQKLVAYIQDKK